jgi:hypothetical protein
LISLPDDHSFADALSALIECAGGQEFPASSDEAVRVQLAGPTPAAQIVVGPWLFNGRYEGIRKQKRLARSGKAEGGLVHTSAVSTKTIRALGALVVGGASHK